MIKTQIIKKDNKPIAVILDYIEYKRLKDVEDDKIDYLNAVKIKKQNKKWVKHQDLKKELKIK
jgi:Ethanolamine utilization protein EutJ (predicted chaperonin)